MNKGNGRQVDSVKRRHESVRCGKYPITEAKSNPSMRGLPSCRSSKPNMHELSDSWELASKNKAIKAQFFLLFMELSLFFVVGCPCFNAVI